MDKKREELEEEFIEDAIEFIKRGGEIAERAAAAWEEGEVSIEELNEYAEEMGDDFLEELKNKRRGTNN